MIDIRLIMSTVVYWLVLFSIVVHGLSIPALNLFYVWRGVTPIKEEAIEVPILSHNQPLPKNSRRSAHRNSVIVNNRFSRPQFPHNFHFPGSNFHFPSSLHMNFFHRHHSDDSLLTGKVAPNASHSEVSGVSGAMMV